MAEKRTWAEPFKIKVVERVRITSTAEPRLERGPSACVEWSAPGSLAGTVRT